MTSSLHNLSVSAVAAIPIVILTMTGIIGGKDVRGLSWDALFLVAGGLSLGLALARDRIAKPLRTENSSDENKLRGFSLLTCIRNNDFRQYHEPYRNQLRDDSSRHGDASTTQARSLIDYRIGFFDCSFSSGLNTGECNCVQHRADRFKRFPDRRHLNRAVRPGCDNPLGATN